MGPHFERTITIKQTLEEGLEPSTLWLTVITLQGYPLADCTVSPALQHVLHEAATQNSSLCSLQTQELPTDVALLNVIDQFPGVFQARMGLPPRRDHDHGITLLPHTKAVSVHPYRYAYHHKDKIEKQVHQLLEEGVIRHSISPFSSPVILVKKNDNSWRMCVDFRA